MIGIFNTFENLWDVLFLMVFQIWYIIIDTDDPSGFIFEFFQNFIELFISRYFDVDYLANLNLAHGFGHLEKGIIKSNYSRMLERGYIKEREFLYRVMMKLIKLFLNIIFGGICSIVSI